MRLAWLDPSSPAGVQALQITPFPTPRVNRHVVCSAFQQSSGVPQDLIPDAAKLMMNSGATNGAMYRWYLRLPEVGPLCREAAQADDLAWRPHQGCIINLYSKSCIISRSNMTLPCKPTRAHVTLPLVHLYMGS